MDTKKLLVFGMILLGIFAMANSASAVINVSWSITPSYLNTTVQNTPSGTSILFNATICIQTNLTIDRINITLPSGFSFVAGSNGTNVSGTSFSNTSNTLIWNNTNTGLLNGSTMNNNCSKFWFNATISLSGDSSVTFTTNATNISTGLVLGNLTTIYVDNINFERAMFTTLDTIDVYFANNNISSVDYTKFVSNASAAWVATAATIDTVNRRIVHLTVVNLTSAIQTAGTTNDLNISAYGVVDLRTGLNGTAESINASGVVIARSLIPGFYTKSASGSRYGYGIDNAYTNRSLLANGTNNISMSMNTAGFTSTWSYKIQELNATTSLWDNMTSPQCKAEPSALSTFDLNIPGTDAPNFQYAAISNSLTNYTVVVYIYNTTGCTGTYQLLELNNWRDIYTIHADTTATTVGSTRTVAAYVKNESGKVNYYLNISGVNDNLGQIPSTFTVTSTTWSINVKPETAGNITIRIVDSSGNLPEASGILASSTKTIIVNPATLATSQIVLTSVPANIYKYFDTDVTINVTLLNQTITGWTTYRNNISYNVTLTAGTLNVSNYSAGVNVSTATFFAFTNSNGTLENFNGTKVGTGNVSISVNVLLDVNRDSVWDYNTTNSNAGTVRDAAALNIISITPSTKTIFAGIPTTVTFNVRNQSNQFIVANVTLTSTTYFYNGSTTTAITTITNTSNGTSVFTIIPEQNGSIAVSITSAGLTPATDSLNVTGAIIARSIISPVLGAKLTFNASYTFQIAVRKSTGVADTAAAINITSGAGYSIRADNNNISLADSNTTIGAMYKFTLLPTVTGYLNLTVISSDGYNATFINAYEVAYQRAYTINTTYMGVVVTTLTAGLNNTINITVTNTSNNVLQGGNLTITYYNASGAQLSTGSVGIVSNSTTITTVVPATAATAIFEVTNTSVTSSGNLSLSVAAPTISVSNIKLSNSTTVLVSKDSPSNLVIINNTIVNITFTVNANYAEVLTISILRINLSNIYDIPLATNTSATVVQLSTVVINNLTAPTGLNASGLYVLINNSNGIGWNLLNITIVEPTITTDKLSVPLNINSTVLINVSAYASGVVGLNVTVRNLSGTLILGTNTTDSNGATQLVISPSTSDTLYIWINGVRTTKTISATSTLSVTYSPSTVYTDTPLIISVRPYGSTTDLVTDSYLSIQAPGATGSTLYPATDGTYTISSPVQGVYKVSAEKTGWTTSASVYITILSPTVRIDFTNVTPSVSSITVNVSSSFTVTVTNSSGAVPDVTVTLSGAGVSTSGTTNSSGIANFTVTATSTGTITVTASKTGYNNMSTTITVSELSSFTSVTASPSSISVGTPTSITVTVVPVLENVTVALSGAGVSTSGLTNASSIATFANVNATSAGTITVTASKTGYTSKQTTITVTSPLASNFTVTAGPSSITLGEVNVTVTITVKNATSNENVTNANVSISGAGITAASALTVNGTATFTSVTPTSAGTITVTVTKSGYNDGSASIAVVTTTTTTTTTSTTTTSTTTTSTTSTTTTSTTTTSTTTTTVICSVKGDTPPCDGKVSDFELLTYIDKWAKGQVGDFDLLTAIDSWAKG